MLKSLVATDVSTSSVALIGVIPPPPGSDVVLLGSGNPKLSAAPESTATLLLSNSKAAHEFVVWMGAKVNCRCMAERAALGEPTVVHDDASVDKSSVCTVASSAQSSAPFCLE